MINKISSNKWHDWVRHYFFGGKTLGIYNLIIMFGLSLFELFFLRFTLYTFILALLMVITSYGVFTDFVAHLWSDEYDSRITMEEFFMKVIKGRTHDLYGLIIFMVALFMLANAINIVIGAILAGLSFSTLSLLVRTKFYH